ncbi:MAG: hypothetical protein PVJ38_07310 [Candidatus Bathyarchaeota archaeon]
MTESIRAFAGPLSQNPIWVFTPDEGELSTTIKDKLLSLDVSLIPFEIGVENRGFPFIGHASAIALAESEASGRTNILAWLAPNTVVLREPRSFLLSEGKSLGFRPVHHTLVGSRYDEPLDPFWTLVYRYCGVPQDRVFPMVTHVDGMRIRPYINAGILIVRPEKGLLQAWRDLFLKVYGDPSFQEFYEGDRLYTIFVHQALLSGVILSSLAKEELQELPPCYNYPLHLYFEDATEGRPSSLEELVTFRHEGFYEEPLWGDKIPAGEPLKRWLAEKVGV